MLRHLQKSLHPQAALVGALLALTGLLFLTPWTVTAQTAASSDNPVRLAQEWEDVLLLEATNYLHTTPGQYMKMQSMVQYAETCMDDVYRQRARLTEMVHEQRQAIMSGRQAVPLEQAAILDKERRVLQTK